MDSAGSVITYRFAILDDCSMLAELNHQLIRDEGHRNPMTVSELDQRMRGWLVGEYQAVIYEVRHKRRRGVGRRAVEILRSQVWPKDKRLTVEVLASNERAVTFWRAVGYRDYTLRLEIMPGHE